MLATRENVKVVIRFRPSNEIEISKENAPECKISSNDKLEYDTINNNIILGKRKTQKQWGFDRVLAPSITQKELFKLVVQQTCKDVVNGYNGTIFVYGQTGSGKTFTMYGPEGGHGSEWKAADQVGLIPRSATYIFDALRADEQIETYRLTCSFLEIYQEKSRDLLNKSKHQQLKIRLNKRHETIMQGLMEHEVSSVDDINKLIAIAIKNRVQASTNMNATSSRSHMLMRMQLVTKLKDGTIRIGSCNFADLAGSEKVKKTKASGTRLDEAKAINKSLTILGQVILALSKQAKHVPFRDSTLTHILRDSLGGNCKTTLIVCGTPHVFNRTETINSLRFGRRCKLVQNKASVNRVFSNDELMKRLAILETQNAKLQDMLKKKAFEKFKNSELPKQIEALKKEIAKLKKKIKELELQNDELGNKMQALQRRNMELEDKQTGDINKINELNAQITALNKEIFTLKNTSMQDKQNRDTMSSQTQILMDKLARIEAQKNEFEKNVNKLNIEMEYLNQQKLESQKEKIELIKRMQNERTEMEITLKQKDKQIKKLMSENENNMRLLAQKDKLLLEMDKLRQEKVEWESLNKFLNGEKDALDKMIVTLNENNDKLTGELDEYKQQLNEFNKDKISMREVNFKLENENRKLDDENKQMEQLLSAEKSKYETALRVQCENNSKKLQEMREKLQQDLAKLKQELTQNHAELMALKEEQLRAEYDAMLTAQQEEYKTNINGKVNELNSKYEQDITKLKQSLLANYTLELNKIKKQFDALNADKMCMKEAQLRLQNENTKLFDDVKEMQDLLEKERQKFEQNANEKDIDIYNKLRLQKEEMLLKYEADMEKLKVNHAAFLTLKQQQLRAEFDTVLENKQAEYKQNLDDKMNALNAQYDMDMKKMKQELLDSYTLELNKLRQQLNDLTQEKCVIEEEKLKLQNENRKLNDEKKEMENLLVGERERFEKSLNERDGDHMSKLEELREQFKVDLAKQKGVLKENYEMQVRLRETQLRAEFDEILMRKENEYMKNMSEKENEWGKKHENELMKLKETLLGNYNQEMKKKEFEFELKYDELSNKYEDMNQKKENEFKKEINDLIEEYKKKMKDSQNEFVQQFSILQQSLTESHERAKNLEIQLSDNSVEINKLNELNDSNITRLQQMQSEMDVLLSQNNALKQELLDKDNENKEKDAQLSGAINQIKQLEESHDKYLFEIDELTRLLEAERLNQDKMREDFKRKEELFGAKQKETLNLLRQQQAKVNEYGELISEKDDLLRSKEWQLRSKEEELLMRKRQKEQDEKNMMMYLLQKQHSMRVEDDKKKKAFEERRRKLDKQRQTLLTVTSLPDMDTLNSMEQKEQKELSEDDHEDVEIEMPELDIESIKDNKIKSEIIAAMTVLKKEQKQAKISMDEMEENITNAVMNNQFTELNKLRKTKNKYLEKIKKCNVLINELQDILSIQLEKEDEIKMNEIKNLTNKKIEEEKTAEISFNLIKDETEEMDPEMSFKNWLNMRGLNEVTIDKLISAEIESLSQLKTMENDLDGLCMRLDIKMAEKVKIETIMKNLPDKLALPSVDNYNYNTSKSGSSGSSGLSLSSPQSSVAMSSRSPPVIANSVSVESNALSISQITDDISMKSSDSFESKEDIINEKKTQFDEMYDFIEIGDCDGIMVKAKFGRHKNAQKINMLLVLFNGNGLSQTINNLWIEFESNYCGITTYVKDIKCAGIECNDLYQFNIPLVIIADSDSNWKKYCKDFNFVTKFRLKTNVNEIKCSMNFNECLYLYFNEKSKLEKTMFLKQWRVKLPKDKIISLNVERIKYCDNIDKLKEILKSQNIFLIHHRTIPKKGDILYCSCYMYSKDIMMEISVATPVKKAIVMVKSNDTFMSLLCANLIKSILCSNVKNEKY